MKRVAVYITAYEDLMALLDCIRAIQKQSYPVEKIFIIDNSKKALQLDLDIELDYIQDFILIKHYPENLGISGGLAIGLQWAIDHNYDFLWTFDQDTIPHSDCLSILISEYEELSRQGILIGIIAPLALDSNIKIELPGHIFERYRFILSPDHQELLYECDVVITSGSLVSIPIAREVELPNQELFIDGVDWDYCLKFKQKGYKIFLTRKTFIQHRFSNLSLAKFPITGKNIMINHYSSLRYYYISRNHTYISLHLCKSVDIPLVIFDRLHRMFRTIAKILFYEPEQKYLKTWACLKGTFDGFIGNLGKRW